MLARRLGRPARRVPKRVQTLDRRITYQLLAFSIFALTWQVAATLAGGILIPTFTETLAALFDLLGSAEFWHAMYVSNTSMALGFVCAVIIGTSVGLLLGRFPLFDRAMNPYVTILLVTPMAGVIPLIVMAFGLGLGARVIFVTACAVVMVIVNTKVGVRGVDPSLIEMARMYGANEARIWRRILLPAATPAIMTGIRLGLGRAITGMVLVELLMVSVALGGLILRYRSMFEGAYLYATILAIVTESLVLIGGLKALEARLVPWAPRNS